MAKLEENKVEWSDVKIEFFSQLAQGRDVLDIGVVQHAIDKFENSTWLHRALCIKANKIVGLDIDKEGVESLVDRGFDVVCANAQDFDLGKQFEVIIAGDLIEHLDNPGGFLECVKTHLRPDGIFAVSTPNPFWWKTFLHVLIKGNSCPHPEHTCWYCEKTLTQLLDRHGLSVTRIEYGTVYILSTTFQKITKVINKVIPLPDRFRHNTIMITAHLER